ncbi:ANK-REP-REGION domain-containing protein [Mycena kentingensis (nom. inval.)]|nr:ANK-REP-REGION domain-containing protein [Mycena kentingensis (nom. inval.)]
MAASLLALAPELHQLIASFLKTKLGVRQAPDLAQINALSQTCSVLHGSVAWLLLDACRVRLIYAKRAIQHALDNSQPELLDRLVAAGVSLDVDIMPPYSLEGERPLYIAALKDDLGLVEKFLELYGDDTAKEAHHRSRRVTPLEVAAGRCNVEMVRVLAPLHPPPPAQEGDPDVGSTYRAYTGNALRCAIGSTADTETIIETVSLLLDAYDADVNFISEYSTPLYVAARAGNLQLVQLLLAHGAKPNIWDASIANIPLHIAAQQQNTEVVSLLLDSGADINTRDGYDAGVLLQVFRHAGTKPMESTLDICRLLISRGAEVHQWNRMRVTPLHRACSASTGLHRPLVELLLQSGGAASVDWEDDKGRTPVDLAREQGLEARDVVRELLLPCAENNEHRQKIDDWLLEVGTS